MLVALLVEQVLRPYFQAQGVETSPHQSAIRF